MSTTIIKPIKDEDFYVVHESIVDSITNFGTRDDLSSVVAPSRLDRADKRGTSALWGNPPWGGWETEEILLYSNTEDPTRTGSVGYIRRERLREFCETLGDDGFFHPPAGLITWETGDE